MPALRRRSNPCIGFRWASQFARVRRPVTVTVTVTVRTACTGSGLALAAKRAAPRHRVEAIQATPLSTATIAHVLDALLE